MSARRFARYQMRAVVVVSGAGAFGRNHRRPKRRLRRTLRAECGAIHRLLQPLQHLPADADLGLARADVFHLKTAIGVVIPEGVAELVAALGNDADAAPA